MRIISRKRLIDYYEVHPDSETALEVWHKKTAAAKWRGLSDLKKTFSSADYVGNDRVVFNIKGNKYRLVAIVLYKSSTVYIRFVGTHGACDRIKDIKEI